MATRLELHEKLCDILGSRHAYFQPPETVKLVYPCFVYSVNSLSPIYADDKTFELNKSYNVTYITRDVDSGVPEQVCWTFPKCKHTRRFVVDNLYHDTFIIYN